MGDSRKGLEQRRALYREAIDSLFPFSSSVFYDRLTSLSFGEGLYPSPNSEWEASGFKEMAYYTGLSYSRLRMRTRRIIIFVWPRTRSG